MKVKDDIFDIKSIRHCKYILVHDYEQFGFMSIAPISQMLPHLILSNVTFSVLWRHIALHVASTIRAMETGPKTGPRPSGHSLRKTYSPPVLYLLHPLFFYHLPTSPPRFCAQKLHSKQQRQCTECQPPDSRQGLLGLDGFRPPQRRGV